MEKLFDLIEKIIQHPELYIGKPSVDRLHAFIGGYLYNNSEIDDCWSSAFTRFVAEYYHITSDHNWSSIIEFFSAGENDAFLQFVDLFYAFMATSKFN